MFDSHTGKSTPRRMHSKSADTLTATVKTVIQLVFGDDTGSAETEDGEESMRVASSATLSRATYRIDLLHMILRRKKWEDIFTARPKPVSVTLCNFVCANQICFFNYVFCTLLFNYFHF